MQDRAHTRTPEASEHRPARVLQRACACGGAPGPTGECAACRRREQRSGAHNSAFQPRLLVGAPTGPYEREANVLADRVLRGGPPTAVAAPITPLVQRAGGDGAAPVPPVVHDVLAAPGRPLDGATRAFMEPRLGYDLGAVRIHTDARAAASARAVQARAYAVGRDVVFGVGEYQPDTVQGRRLLAHELVHTLQQTGAPEALQRDPENEAAKDPVCSSFEFLVTYGLIHNLLAVHHAKGRSETRLAMIRALKLIRRCATAAQQKEVREDLATALGTDPEAALWSEAGTAFGGYTGMYPGYASDIKRELTELGVSETASFGAFELSASGSTHRSRAKRRAAREASDLARTDIVYFRGHQFAQYRAPGVFSDYEEERGFDLRYIDQTGGFPNVKLMISTSCATLCKEALEVFTGLFPNAVILGYRKSAPRAGAAVRAAFRSKLVALARPLLLDQAVDISAVISAWKAVIEENHAGHTSPVPGYYDGVVHYWDGTSWDTVGASEPANKCKRKGDFRGQFPAPARSGSTRPGPADS